MDATKFISIDKLIATRDEYALEHFKLDPFDYMNKLLYNIFAATDNALCIKAVEHIDSDDKENSKGDAQWYLEYNSNAENIDDAVKVAMNRLGQ